MGLGFMIWLLTPSMIMAPFLWLYPDSPWPPLLGFCGVFLWCGAGYAWDTIRSGDHKHLESGWWWKDGLRSITRTMNAK